MIQADHYEAHVHGMAIDIIFEMNHIIDIMNTNHPDILHGVLAAWAEEMLDAIKDIDKNQLTIVAEISSDYIKMRKDAGASKDE